MSNDDANEFASKIITFLCGVATGLTVILFLILVVWK